MGRDHLSFHDFVLDQLAEVHGVRSKAMFGGHGLYRGEVLFGILSRTSLYFKVSADTRAEYETQGMKPFCPNGKQTLTSFYEVPVEILEQSDELALWAQGAISAATRAALVRPRRHAATRPRRRRTSAR